MASLKVIADVDRSWQVRMLERDEAIKILPVLVI